MSDMDLPLAVRMMQDGYLMKIDALQAENAKLRELVRHLYVCMEHYEANGSISCETCPFDNDTQDCDFERRMAELGMEVDV